MSEQTEPNLVEWLAGAERLENIRGYVCKKCRRYHGDAPDSERMARYCCTSRQQCPCGQLSELYCDRCPDCRRVARDAAEAARIASATVVQEGDYAGPVFVDGLGDEFFRDVGELVDHLQTEHDEDWRQHLPAAVWACDVTPIVTRTYDRATDQLSDNAYEDWDADRLQGVEEFQSACAAFEAANKDQVAWNPDFKRRIEVDWAAHQ